MICNQLVKCVESLQKDKKAEKTKRAKNKDKKASSLSYKCPCSDEGRIKKCVQFSDKRERPSCSEKGKTYTLTIGQHMFHTTCLRLDGGVVDSLEFRRCDYLFSLADAEKRTILTELKGTNVGDAMEQLEESLRIEALKGFFHEKKAYGRISCTASVPNIYAKKRADLQKQFLRRGGNLKIQKSPFEESYTEMDELYNYVFCFLEINFVSGQNAVF